MSRGLPTIETLLILLLALRPAHAHTTWYVDDDCTPPGLGTEADPFCTIQDGVDASFDGDTVFVHSGTYTGTGNRDIWLFGKRITVRSVSGPNATTIDCQGGPGAIHRGFFLVHGESRESMIEGFTITGGYLIGVTDGVGNGGGGAAIYVRDSSPTITRCILRDNVSATSGGGGTVDGRGGAIYIDGNSQAVIDSCIIHNNISGKRGGGMYVGFENSAVSVQNTLICNNSASNGGGIHSTFGTTSIVNTTLANNSTVFGGGGIVSSLSDVILSNCIFWGNVAGSGNGPQIFGGLTIEYSAVQGGLEEVWEFGPINWGPGTIDADPLFVDPDNRDFRLLPGSPCIDAGNNLAVPAPVVSDLDGLARFADDLNTPDTGNPGWGVGMVDMGAYEFGGDDCNNNGIPDTEDVDNGATDCDANNVPDECQPDCDGSGQADTCEEVGEDCDGNGRMDECDPDCNGNGHPDACDLADGDSDDCNDNGVPDECEVYPPITQQPADAEVQEGDFAFFAVQVDGLLLEYQWRKDGADLVDTERIFGAQSAGLVILDVQSTDAGAYDCVIIEGINGCTSTSDAATLTVLPLCPADFDGDGAVGAFDLAFLLGAWGPCPDPEACPADLDADGAVGAFDLATLLGAWGSCQ